MRIACLDVGYQPNVTIAACLVFNEWNAAESVYGCAARLYDPPPPYEPGEQHRRELPFLLRVLPVDTFDAIIVDGYAWVDEARTRGLGARLYEAVGQRSPVIGVAKTHFQGAPAIPVTRGTSRSPLYVSAVGMPTEEAAEHIRQMHGLHRIPTLLKRVDELSRTGI